MRDKLAFISAKIKKIMHEGIKGKKVSQDRAIAVAYSMARRMGMKVKSKKGRKK